MSYIDTSVLAAYYCPEPLSSKAEEIITRELSPTVSELTEVELFSAVARKVREGEIDRDSARRILSLFSEHLKSGLYLRIFLHSDHFAVAREWLRRLEAPLRTLDALHLAAAVEKKLVVTTADIFLAKTARKLGIPVELVRL